MPESKLIAVFKELIEAVSTQFDKEPALGGKGDIDEVLASPSVEISPSGIGRVEGFKSRLPVNMMPVPKRTKGFVQVELGFDQEEAIAEAKRCLWCDLADGDPGHSISHGWSCKRGRANTARRFIS